MPFWKNFFSKFKGGASNVIQVSFLPEKEYEKPEVIQARKRILIFSIIISLILGLAFWLYFFVQTIAWQTKKTQIEAALKEPTFALSAEDLRKVESLTIRSAPLKNLVSRHLYWTNVFKFLEENTLPNVSYSQFAGSGTTVNLIGRATDYTTLARQILAFKTNSLVKDLKITNLNAQISGKGEVLGINFNLSLTFDPKIFTLTE